MTENETALKFILTATRKSDKARLHLIDRNIESDNSKYAVCWNYDTASQSWDWGTYCGNLKNALSAFVEKCGEHGFNEVHEGYL